MPAKKTVNLKRFLTDFKTGVSDAELMTRHGLDKRGLQKMLRVLEERRLVPTEDIKGSRNSPPLRQPPEPTAPSSVPLPESKPDTSHAQLEDGQDGHSKCSQCGAQVTEQMLTCPECGHVLSGETRWSRVQPEKSFLRRVPPWLVGCIIALPIAIGLYVVFKHILVPMSTASIHKRAEAVGKPAMAKRQPSRSPKGANPAQLPIYAQAQRFVDKGILQAVNPDYTSFTVTERWYELSRDDKLAFVTELGAALLASGMTAPFEVKDDSGIPGARATPQAIELIDKYGFTETVPREDADPGPNLPTEGTSGDQSGSPRPTGIDR
jgi:hypothetical protein